MLPLISPGPWQNFGGTRPFEDGRTIVRRAFDVGITHFDLANNYSPPYGGTEANFGRMFAADLAPYRDEIVVPTKAGYDMWPGPHGDGGSRRCLLTSLDRSLQRMGVDYAEIFCSDSPDPATPLEETMRALDFLKRRSITGERRAQVRALDAIARRHGQSLAQMALAWVLRDRRVTSALVGVPSVAQLEKNLANLDSPDFSAEELAEIDRYAVG